MNYNFDTKSHNILFTSDTHFSHNNIIKYCNRPFANADEMNEALIKNWNDAVGPEDTVFHLGDFAFGNPKKALSILNKLNGNIYLVIGNHDYGMLHDCPEMYSAFAGVHNQLRININGQRIWMNHFPFLTFEGMWNGENSSWQLFGHVHSSKSNTTGLDIERMKYLFPNQYDVGVDNNNYAPVGWHRLCEIIKEQEQSLNLHREHN